MYDKMLYFMTILNTRTMNLNILKLIFFHFCIHPDAKPFRIKMVTDKRRIKKLFDRTL